MSFEAWVEFRRGEQYDTTTPLCYWCGRECSGDTTTRLEVDGVTGEVPVCDDEDACEEG